VKPHAVGARVLLRDGERKGKVGIIVRVTPSVEAPLDFTPPDPRTGAREFPGPVQNWQYTVRLDSGEEL